MSSALWAGQARKKKARESHSVLSARMATSRGSKGRRSEDGRRHPSPRRPRHWHTCKRAPVRGRRSGARFLYWGSGPCGADLGVSVRYRADLVVWGVGRKRRLLLLHRCAHARNMHMYPDGLEKGGLAKKRQMARLGPIEKMDDA